MLSEHVQREDDLNTQVVFNLTDQACKYLRELSVANEQGELTTPGNYLFTECLKHRKLASATSLTQQDVVVYDFGMS